MMRVVACIATLHDPWLVLLAAVVCIGGSWVSFKLFRHARRREGVQRAGWTVLAAIATGSSVWCTHFIAMLAYDVQAPVTYEPILTMTSLLVAIAGAGLAYHLALRFARASTWAAGSVMGLSVAAMHYLGMNAYRVDGLVTWDWGYVAVSLVLAAALSTLAFQQTRRGSDIAALGLFVLAVVSLHFTGMTGVSVEPFITGAPLVDSTVATSMAVAVAGVALIIAGTGVAAYMIDSDVNERNLDRLRHMALTDALTGLPNRAAFNAHLAFKLDRARDTGRELAVVGIDLDKFKEINDLRGHEAGDEALRIIASRLMGCLVDGEFVARIGGDEFAAIKFGANAHDLNDFLARLERQLFTPMRLGDFETVTGASVGVSVFPRDADSAARLVGNADLAMYRAKSDVTRTLCFYEVEMDDAARVRRDLSLELRNAIQRGQLELYYQVQNDVSTDDIVGYEVLLRWNNPQRGFVPPSEFIPLAEETGAIIEIGEWVLREACRRAASWSEPHKIAVNISAVQLTGIDLPKLVHEILLETGLSPARLELEITESSIIRDKERSLRALRMIRALGVTIAIDDFGTGYSSLDTLRTFPFDRIKLDRSFMSEIEDSAQARAIVRAVLALGRSLDIRVLAEGVETENQLSMLRDEGCNEAQGYLLGRPHAQRSKSRRTQDLADAPVEVLLVA